MVFEDSRYLSTEPYFDSNDILVLSRRRPIEYNVDKMTLYTFKEGDTVSNIAYRMYENQDLWWCIMDANPKYETEMDIKPGDVLYIPDYSEIVEGFDDGDEESEE